MSVGEKFLYLAYVLAGLIYGLYAWNLAWRLRRSQRELKELRARLEAAGPTGSPPA
jgi:HAMP domain-containing protein